MANTKKLRYIVIGEKELTESYFSYQRVTLS